jgi:hypothetical protein
VALGIAFLMAVLTGHALRQGVAAERAARTEVARMESFLVAETGPLRGRDIAVLPVGPLNDMECRLLRRIVESGVRRLNRPPGVSVAERGGQGAAGPWRETPAADLARGVSAVLVLGDGAVPAAIEWPAWLAAARQPVVAFSRRAQTGASVRGGRAVVLDRVLRDDERQAAAAERRRETFRTLWITAISLLVTVIGVSNAMLMSVTERFREIGAMKCLGALSRFIRQVFLIEATLMGLAGSILGGALGCGFAVAATGLSYGFRLAVAAVNPLTLCGYFLACVGAGVALAAVAGVYPARFAARMVPAAALRSTI